MTVQEFARAQNLKILAGESGLSGEITGGYIGDLLSWVMGRAAAGDAWLTVMGNVNAIAVAKLAEIACIVLCEGASLDADAKAQADANGVPVLWGEENSYTLSGRLRAMLG
jgi:predicted transcriptional regulator